MLDLHLVGADVLGDAAGLGGGDVGVADAVQQAGLAVVDVAHHRHHGRTRLELGGVFLLDKALEPGRLRRHRLLDRHVHLARLKAEVRGDDGGSVVVDHLGKRRHHAVFHEVFDDLHRRQAQQLRQLADAERGRDLHRARALRGRCGGAGCGQRCSLRSPGLGRGHREPAQGKPVPARPTRGAQVLRVVMMCRSVVPAPFPAVRRQTSLMPPDPRAARRP